MEMADPVETRKRAAKEESATLDRRAGGRSGRGREAFAVAPEPPRNAAETVRAATRAVVDEERKAAEEGANTAQQATASLGALNEEAGEIAERGGAALAKGTLAASDRATETGSALAEGLQKASQLWSDYADETMRRGIEATHAFLRCRTIGDLVEVQSDFVRDTVGGFLTRAAQLSELSTRIASEAMRGHSR
jgi:hypothetical protein